MQEKSGRLSARKGVIGRVGPMLIHLGIILLMIGATLGSLQGQKIEQFLNPGRSLDLLKAARSLSPEIPTKSGIMLGLGESNEEVIQTLKDLRDADCQRITLGLYLRPSLAHLPVQKYWHPNEFEYFKIIARDLGFKKVNSGPLVRSSYHADYD